MNGYSTGGAFLGMGETAANMAAGQAMKRPNRTIRRDQEKIRQANHGFQQGEWAQDQKDVNRTFGMQKENQLAQDTHDTGPSSSINKINQTNLEAERGRRYDSIQRRRNLENSNFQNETEMIQAKQKIQKIQDSMALVDGMINGGASGAAQSYSQRTY